MVETETSKGGRISSVKSTHSISPQTRNSERIDKFLGRRLVCFLGIFASTLASAAGLDSRAHTDFEWFSSLGFPDVKGCPCVRLENGGSWTSAGEPIQIDHIDAFVLSTNGGTLTLFATDLSSRTAMNAVLPKGTMRHRAFDRVDLREEAKVQIKDLQSRPVKDDPFRHYQPASEERAEIFVLAWACWRQGLEQEAQQLYEQARKLPARTHGHGFSANFREGLEEDFGHAMMWPAIGNLGNPSVSRTEVLRQLEAILKNYPHSRHCERARKTAKLLKRMIGEDQAHADLSSAELDRAPVKEQVREWIYRLRDQNGHQIMFPGRCDIFAVLPSSTNSPAHQLVRFGYAAVPQLIAVLDSDTLTRSQGAIRFTQDPDFVLTVGDCAEAILQKITGKSFFLQQSGRDWLSMNYMSAAGQGPAARKAAEAWWAAFQIKGEKQALIDAVARGEHDAPEQAKLLCQRYPGVATAFLIRGAKAATNSSVRSRLVDQVSKMGETPGFDFLRRELLNGPYLESRVAAAFALRLHGEHNATDAMIRAWREEPEKRDKNDYAWQQVVEYLAGCDSVEAISALAADLPRRSQRAKFEVITSLGETDRWSWRPKPQTLTPKTLEAIERALAGALEDTTECFNTSFSRNDKSLSDPRICDLAAWFLSDRWPTRYTFEVSASLETRNRRRIECLNVWREAHALPLLPVLQPKLRPQRAKLERSEATKVTAIEWSEDSADPRPAFAARIASFKGKLLSSKGVIGLLAFYAAHPEPNAMGLEIEAFKDADLMGVRVVARLVPGKPPNSSVGWDTRQHVILGSKPIQGSLSGGVQDYYTEDRAWEDLESAIQQALAAPAETPFEISVRIAGTGGTRIGGPSR